MISYDNFKAALIEWATIYGLGPLLREVPINGYQGTQGGHVLRFRDFSLTLRQNAKASFARRPRCLGTYRTSHYRTR